MKSLFTVLIASAIGVAIAAAPAAAAKHGKKKSSAASHSQVQHGASPVAYRGGGVRSGPLYNGQDYIGEDPDPSIRAQLIKDMTRYYGAH